MGTDWPVVGNLAPIRFADLGDVLGDVGGVGAATLAVNDPPWTEIAARVGAPGRVVDAGDMARPALEAAAAAEQATGTETVIGIGGGTAIDTAKYLAWRTGKRLVLAPTVLSVDAAFTREIAVRDEGRVRYVGSVAPELVVVDAAVVRHAPERLNRAGIGDVLSCHTALADWRTSTARADDAAHPWRADLAALADTLLAALADAADDVRALSDDGVRFLAQALRHVGAACNEAGHARFEEGSEHFLAYALEHDTGRRFVHGELIAMCVVAIATVQRNDPLSASAIVARTGVRAHPADLGIAERELGNALLGLRGYARREHLWPGVADHRELTAADARAAWAAISALPRA